MADVKDILELLKRTCSGKSIALQWLLILLRTIFIIMSVEFIMLILYIVIVEKIFNHTKDKASKYQDNERKQLKIMKFLYRLKKYYQFSNLLIEIFAPVLILDIFGYMLVFIAIFIKELTETSNHIPLLLSCCTLILIVILSQMAIYITVTINSYVGGKDKFKQDFMKSIKSCLREIDYASFKIRKLKEKLKSTKKSKMNNRKELILETDYFKTKNENKFKNLSNKIDVLNNKLDVIIELIKTNQKK